MTRLMNSLYLGKENKRNYFWEFFVVVSMASCGEIRITFHIFTVNHVDTQTLK